MKAIVQDRYGPPDVLRISEVPQPVPNAKELLVRVTASSVTTADWRLRAAEFPGVLAVPGRLMFGLFRPRNKILGGVFAGKVVEAGQDVDGFVPGDRVFGVSGKGAHAEFLTIAQDGAVVHTPDTITDEEAAATPFGALSALVFLRDFARITPGQSVLIIGASGGVGSYAVQIAKRMGAHVTGVASAANHLLLRNLGADEMIDYRAEDFTDATNRYDVVFDTVGATDFKGIRGALKPKGQFIPLNFGMKELWQALWARFHGGRRIRIGVSGDRREHMQLLAGWLSAGDLRAVVDTVYPMADFVEAHSAVETRHRKGTVVLRMSSTEAKPAAPAA
ncbi:NAD(P)-dependent alcohol dehydrogenase [Primorskyibacter flagellatus]|uniref:NAD(P)-dependent alcohol dehydrogenase n=1 Tax=Primorskyibacter flagellatus TaxID=1387277 RepID=UPI003A8CF4C1